MATRKQIAAGHYVLATTRTCSARCHVSSGLAFAHQLCVYLATITHQLDPCVVNPFWMVRVGGGKEDGGASGGAAGAGGAGGEAARGARQTLAEAGVVGADASLDDDVVMEDPLVVSKGDRYCYIMYACKALAAQGRVNPIAYDKTMEGIEELVAKLRVHSVKLPMGRPAGAGPAAPLNPLRANEGRGKKDDKRKKPRSHG